jgi:hypothetical protein
VQVGFTENYTFQQQNAFKVHTGSSHKSLSSQLSSGMQKTKDILVQLLVMNLIIINILCTHFWTNLHKVLSLNPEVKYVPFISDGAATQFRQFTICKFNIFQGTL